MVKIYFLTIFRTMTMQVMTSTNIKNKMGEVIEIIQREPILMTKNNRPVAFVVSIDDVQGTYLAELAAEQEAGYEEWAKAKVKKAMQQFEKNGSKGITSDELKKRIFKKIK